MYNKKRETGFEPATLALARRYSTTEPLAHQKDMIILPYLFFKINTLWKDLFSNIDFSE